jgi:hypothetical protein
LFDLGVKTLDLVFVRPSPPPGFPELETRFPLYGALIDRREATP